MSFYLSSYMVVGGDQTSPLKSCFQQLVRTVVLISKLSLLAVMQEE